MHYRSVRTLKMLGKLARKKLECLSLVRAEPNRRLSASYPPPPPPPPPLPPPPPSPLRRGRRKRVGPAWETKEEDIAMGRREAQHQCIGASEHPTACFFSALAFWVERGFRATKHRRNEKSTKWTEYFVVRHFRHMRAPACTSLPVSGTPLLSAIVPHRPFVATIDWEGDSHRMVGTSIADRARIEMTTTVQEDRMLSPPRRPCVSSENGECVGAGRSRP